MQPAIQIQNVNFAYGAKQVLHDVTLDIPARQITAFIGPSGPPCSAA
jgi:phosphate transport system ATP-binding protein